MNYLSLCAILRNESLYVSEWVKYHHALGVEQFYLWNNDSTDNTPAVIKELSTKYPIELNHIRGIPAQFKAYEQTILFHRNDSQWMIFIDGDEFLVPSVPLHKFLKDFEKYPALCVHWYFFGSNGHQVYSPEPVLERFTKREASVNPHVKTIANPRRTLKVTNPHRFVHDENPVDEHQNPIPGVSGLVPGGTCDLIQCNHYGVKSYEECAIRRAGPRTDINQGYPPMPGYFIERDFNQVEDFKARDLWRAVP